MFDLKPLSKAAVAGALSKAERYRLLNEPHEAESICLDVLAVDPENKEATIILLLALTDQFEEERQDCVAQAKALLPKLDDYQRAYYGGIISERLAKARLGYGRPGSGGLAHGLLVEAMKSYEAAEQIRPAGNDDALLRWNACARLMMRNPQIKPIPEDDFEPYLE